jgi:iron complex outermembrane recepter protein
MTKNETRKLTYSLGSPVFITVSALAMISATGAFAADQPARSDQPAALEEVVVTAQRTSENLQRSPVAVTALTAQSLAARQITSVGDLSVSIPNTLISAPTAVPNAARIYIRGAGQDNSGILADPAVAIYVDGVYMPRTNGALFDFSDVDRVEVLRGPQGTLYGRNASGGAINIITKTPGSAPEISGDVAYGSFNTLDIRGYAAGPLIEDKLSGSISGLYRRRDGIVTNTITGEKLDARKLGSLRGKLRFTPSEPLTVTASADYTEDDSDALTGVNLTNYPGVVDSLATPNRDPYTTEITGKHYGKLTAWGASVQASYKFGDWTLNSITGYRHLDNRLILPLVMLPSGPIEIDFNIHDNSWSQEFNATVDTTRFKGVVGVYYFGENARDLESITSPPRNLYRETDAAAAYAQGTFKITNTLGLTGGLRYTYEQTKFTQDFYTQRSYAQSAKQDWKAWTPKIGLEWQIQPSFMTYVSFTEGFKSGGFNAIAPNTNTGTGVEGGPIAYNPEKVKSYEAGFKYQTNDNRFRLNGAIFRAEYTGLQLPVYFPGTVNTYTSNATGARVQGVELEASYRPSKVLELYGSFSHQVGKYTQPFACADAHNNVVNCEGRQIKALIPTQASAGFTFTPELDIPGRVRLNGSWTYISGYWNNVSNTIYLEHTGAHGLLNASVAYETPDGHWTFSVEGKNLADQKYYAAVLQVGNATSPAVAGYPADPRIVMARVKFNY